MAKSEVLARLAVELSMDSAAFTDGADEAAKAQKKLKKELDAAQRHFEEIGGRIQNFGKGLTKAITAPILAAGGAVVAGMTQLAGSVKDFEKSAQLTGATFEGFQRLAHAARTVGVEGDKLTDIFRDVQDKVGDFISTGGGGMADFFEKIGPKVGVTAEAFRKLSGPDALQLYYDSLIKAGVSQSEMTFYLEAIASDATDLIPLLKDGGKAFRELGAGAAVLSQEDAAGLKAYNDAMTTLKASFQQIMIAIAKTGIAEKFAEWVNAAAAFVQKLAQTSPETIKMVGAIAAVAAAIGPLVVGFGAVTTALAPLLAGFKVLGGANMIAGLATAFGPLGIALTAVGGAAYLVWQNWDKLKPAFDAIWQSVQSDLMPALTQLKDALVVLWDGPVGEAVRALIAGFAEFSVTYAKTVGPAALALISSFATNVATAMRTIDSAIKAVTALFRGEWSTAWDMAKAAATGLVSVINTSFGGLPAYINDVIGRTVGAIRKEMIDRLNAIWDGVKAKIEAVKGWFFGLYDAVVGNSYVPDMVDEIGLQMARLQAAMVDPAAKATKATKATFRQLASDVAGLTDRLFPAQAAVRGMLDDLAMLDKALKAGLIDGRTYSAARDEINAQAEQQRIDNSPIEDPGDLTAGMRLPDISVLWDDQGDGLKKTNAEIADDFARMAQDVMGSLSNLVSAIKGGGFLDIMGSLVSAFQQFAPMIFGGGSSNLPKFATGGSMRLGGFPGVDTNTLSLNGSPIAQVSRDEMMHIVPANDRGPSAPKINNYYQFDGVMTNDEFWDEIDARDGIAMAGGAGLAEARRARYESRRLGARQ